MRLPLRQQRSLSRHCRARRRRARPLRTPAVVAAPPQPSSAHCRAGRRRCRRERATGSSSTCGSTRPSALQRRSSGRSGGHPRAAPGDGGEGGTGATWTPSGRAGYKVRPNTLASRATVATHYFHAEYTKQRGGRFTLEPSRPKALIFANAPGRPLVLVGAMWSMRRGERGPTPAGPIVRWHSHLVCVRGQPSAAQNRSPGGSCPAGAQLRPGHGDAPRLVHGRPPERILDRAPVPRALQGGLLGGGCCS